MNCVFLFCSNFCRKSSINGPVVFFLVVFFRFKSFKYSVGPFLRSGQIFITKSKVALPYLDNLRNNNILVLPLNNSSIVQFFYMDLKIMTTRTIILSFPVQLILLFNRDALMIRYLIYPSIRLSRIKFREISS